MSERKQQTTLIFIILFLLIFSSSIAQNSISNAQLWTHYTINNGLPDNQIRHVLEDADGSLLVITVNSGIYRYDGLQFQPLSINAELPTLFIQQVIKDHQNHLWIACNYAGIWIYDRGELSAFQYNHLFKEQHFAALFVDKQGNCWIDVNQVGLFRYDGSKCENITEQYDLPREDIVQIQQRTDSSFNFLFVNTGLYQFDLNKDKQLTQVLKNDPQILNFHTVQNGDTYLARKGKGITRFSEQQEFIILNQPEMREWIFDFFLVDSNGKTWFCWNNSIYCYDCDQLYDYSPGKFQFGRPFQDRFQNTWFATDNGLFKYINSQVKSWSFPQSNIKSRPHSLSNSTNRFLFQDRQAKLWFTDDDQLLYYFDGKQVRQFQFPDSLKNLKITDFTQDANGHYWLATHGSGVLCYDGKNFTRPIPTDSLPGDFISSLFIDAQNRLWIGSLTSLPHLSNRKSPGIEPFFEGSDNVSLDQAEITSLFVDSDERIWIGTFGNMLFYSSCQQFMNASPVKNRQAFFMNIQNLYRHEDLTWGTSHRGVFYYDLANDNFQLFPNPALIPQILDAPFANDFRWITGDFFQNNSIYLLKQYSRFKKDPARPIYNISSFCEDSAHGVWVGSYNVGLFHISEDTLVHFGSRDGFHSLKISSLLIDKNSTLWVGTLDQGLFQLKNRKHKPPFQRLPTFERVNKISGEEIGTSIYTLFEDSQGRLWIGTLDNGLVLIHHNKISVYHKNLPHPSIWGIGESSSGEIYVCLKDASFAKLVGDGVEILPREAILYNGDLRSAFKSKTINFRKHLLEADKVISSGLVCWDGKKIRKFTVENGLPGHEITDIGQTADGRIWIATFNTGLAVFENDHFTPFVNQQLSRISRFISLKASNDSTLWVISQDEGLALIHGDSVKVWGSNSKAITIQPLDIHLNQHNQAILSTMDKFYYFNHGDIPGLPQVPAQHDDSRIMPFFLLDTEEQLWFTTLDRKLFCYPLTGTDPIIKIRSCQIGNDLFHESQLIQPIQRGYRDRAYAIEFFGYHSSFPAQQIKYSFRLKKGDEPADWGAFTTQNRFIYTQLQPGKNHVFEVRAQTPDGHISKTLAGIEIRIEAEPIYLRSWFQLLLIVILLIFIASYFIYRYYKINQFIFRRRFNPYIAGEPIIKSDLFFGRDDVVRKILSIIHNNSVMITGERRIGKTSLLIQLKNQLFKTNDPGLRFIPIFIDLQGINQWEFFHAMMHDIIEQAGDELASIQLRANDKTKDYSHRDFSADFRRVIQHFSTQNSKRVKFVLLIDEADAMNQYDQMIHAQLRRIFMQEFSLNFAAIISGTNYIQSWNRPESPWWNLFTLIELNSFTKADAAKLIQAPVKGVFKFKNDAIDAIIEVTGGKPYPIQTLCMNLIYSALDRNRRTIYKEDVLDLLNQ